ncbi:SDR family NAD(P)-dependent oxidoreductase [Conexibacter sp. W3-3-2]|uniref:Short-chain dehydrogenase n=1 Tax=Paraconexibacter algicola TaxID=2133960 RepID=A0A2T4UKF5_9ACTN|nr:MULTISPECIES: SDR family NAD(P)-dependent oxidoreductase [Solirubrobacterales]MTD46056.1 SDR family NAD(P)-dependent oxidoreductase [Conexibacter sp. W3-3-2]PTL59723.1 short-chain dehydrogenase [Paraconexibacter algicola]
MSTRGVVVVSGASRGIGREVATTLAADGWTVLAGARDPATLEGVDGVEPVQLDVTDGASVRAVAARASEFGGATALVNNAGIIGENVRGPVLEQDLQEVRRVFETNVLGAWALLQALTRQLRAAGPRGRVVNVSSGMGQLSDAQSGAGAYRVSKVALNMLTVTAANELRADGVLVNATCPGWVQTDMGGPQAQRTVAEGAASVLWGVRLPDDGPTGGFFRDGEPLPW